MQLMYDSIADLDAALVAGLARDDHGHFQGSAEAFRHWDEDGEVSASCTRCHSADGLVCCVKPATVVKNGRQDTLSAL